MCGGCTTMEVCNIQTPAVCSVILTKCNNEYYVELYCFVGLALILACILQSSSTWKNCKFRIFGVTDKVECLSVEKKK